ncbi:hypothetical protein Tco_1569554 [Tanacetum coccineum]
MSKKLGLKCSTSNCGSNPTSNKNNDRISQTPSRNIKNKVEAQPRKVNKKNRVVEPICDVDVKHSLLNANSKLICATCNKSMFDDIHDICLLDFVKNVNGLPIKESTPSYVKPSKPYLKVYSRRPKNVSNSGSSKKAKIVKSKNANNSEPSHTWGSNAIEIPLSSSLVNDRFSRLSSGTVRFGNDQIARIMGYGDYQLGMLLSQGYTTSRGLDITCFLLDNFATRIWKFLFGKTLSLFGI